MLVNDSKDSNRIIDYSISFDDESRKTALEILDDSFSKITTSVPTEEPFLLHDGFKLTDLKWKLEDRSKSLKGGIKDLSMHYYTYSEPQPKKSTMGDISLGEEILVSKTTIACHLSSTINFILNHLNPKERDLFLTKLGVMERAYIKTLLGYVGSERLTEILGELKDIRTFLKTCQSFDELMKPENARMLERIRYFKTVYSLVTLRACGGYDRSYLGSIDYMCDEMERETIENIQTSSTENTEMIKLLNLKPKCIIQRQK